MWGFFLASVESDRALLNSSSRVSRVLQSLGINRIPFDECPEVRRLECMMICLCRADVFDRLFVRSLLGVEGSRMIMYKVLEVISCPPVAE